MWLGVSSSSLPHPPSCSDKDLAYPDPLVSLSTDPSVRVSLAIHEALRRTDDCFVRRCPIWASSHHAGPRRLPSPADPRSRSDQPHTTIINLKMRLTLSNLALVAAPLLVAAEQLRFANPSSRDPIHSFSSSPTRVLSSKQSKIRLADLNSPDEFTTLEHDDFPAHSVRIKETTVSTVEEAGGRRGREGRN